MNVTLLKALLALAPVLCLTVGATTLVLKDRSRASLLQLLGAAGALTVVLVHICEALGLFPWMQWGQVQSIGHYVDLVGALLGLILFPIGYLLHALTSPTESD